MTADSSRGGEKKTIVKVGLGELPPLWDFPAVFFANLESIFFGNSEKTRELIDNVQGFHSYGGRLIPVLGILYRGDKSLLLLRKAPEPALLEYYCEDLALSVPDLEIISHNFASGFGRAAEDRTARKRIRQHPAKVIDGFVTDEHLSNAARSLGKKLINKGNACKDANDKVLLNRFLSSVGLPMFDGREAVPGDDLEDALSELKAGGYGRAVIKTSLGASGFGMYMVDLGKKVVHAPQIDIFHRESVLVQGWVEEGLHGVKAISSPSVQFFCGDDNRVSLYDLTDQLLSRHSVHEGNISPPLSIPAKSRIRDEIIRQAGEVASWIASLGYKGTGSIDFLVFTQDGRMRVYVCEVNARVTGATYPSLLARHFKPNSAWLMRNMLFQPAMDARSFLKHLDAQGLLFKPQREDGVIPVNIIVSDSGKVEKAQLLFLAETADRCLEMLNEFPSRATMECSFDRD